MTFTKLVHCQNYSWITGPNSQQAANNLSCLNITCWITLYMLSLSVKLMMTLHFKAHANYLTTAYTTSCLLITQYTYFWNLRPTSTESLHCRGPSLFFREWSLNKLLGSTNLLLQHHCTFAEQLRAYFAQVLQWSKLCLCCSEPYTTNRSLTATYLALHSSGVSMHCHWFVLDKR